jgi:hypothetical protein
MGSDRITIRTTKYKPEERESFEGLPKRWKFLICNTNN